MLNFTDTVRSHIDIMEMLVTIESHVHDSSELILRCLQNDGHSPTTSRGPTRALPRPTSPRCVIDAGYSESFLTVEEGVSEYMVWLQHAIQSIMR